MHKNRCRRNLRWTNAWPSMIGWIFFHNFYNFHGPISQHFDPVHEFAQGSSPQSRFKIAKILDQNFLLIRLLQNFNTSVGPICLNISVLNMNQQLKFCEKAKNLLRLAFIFIKVSNIRISEIQKFMSSLNRMTASEKVAVLQTACYVSVSQQNPLTFR